MCESVCAWVYMYHVGEHMNVVLDYYKSLKNQFISELTVILSVKQFATDRLSGVIKVVL